MNTALTTTSALESRIAELESGPPSTGLRDITSVIASHLVAGQTGQLLATRIGQWVTLSFDMLQFDTDGWVILGLLPTGLQPFTDHHFPVFWGDKQSTFTDTSMIIVRSNNSLSFKKLSNDYARATLTYPTEDVWPSTLPGNPA